MCCDFITVVVRTKVAVTNPMKVIRITTNLDIGAVSIHFSPASDVATASGTKAPSVTVQNFCPKKKVI